MEIFVNISGEKKITQE